MQAFERNKMNIDPKQVRIPRPRFQITQDIIDNACRQDSRHCMIAEAVKKQIPNATKVIVDIATIRFTDQKKGFRYIYLTPPIAQKALVDFDDGISIAPFSFRVKTAQVTSIVATGEDGKRTIVHKLGQPKVTKATKDQIDVLGGKAPPRFKPLHPSHSSMRMYGARGFIDGWKIAS